jgi:hypothetical protein
MTGMGEQKEANSPCNLTNCIVNAGLPPYPDAKFFVIM